MMRKPYAAAADNNRDPILSVLRVYFADRTCVLEIGSGTGQHAVHFAGAMPQLTWQASDLAQHLDGIRAWLDEAALPNLPAPIALDVNDPFPTGPTYDAVYMANTLHIMGWPEIKRLFAALPALMSPDAKLAIYGPFSYGGRHTSESNARFDAWLRHEAPHQGVRDFEAVDALARAAGLALVEDCALPVNNRCIVWQRRS